MTVEKYRKNAITLVNIDKRIRIFRGDVRCEKRNQNNRERWL